MKNPIILKDELVLLKADRSAVLIELRSLSTQLIASQEAIEESQQILADIKEQILNETARRDEMHDRAVLLRKEVGDLNQELNTLTIKVETARVKNNQETKLHLGRIKELSEEEEALLDSINNLKITFDKNMNAMNMNLSEATTNYKDIDTKLSEKRDELEKATEKIESIREEEKKLTKDRLKREDKIRSREKSIDMKERGLEKREEDLQTMSNDLMIIYFRLKDLYAKVDPSVDIDKLITKAEKPTKAT